MYPFETWEGMIDISIGVAHLGDPVVVVPAPVDPVLEELDALEEVVLEGGGSRAREHGPKVHARERRRERRRDEVQPVVGQVQAVVLPLLDDVLEHLITEKTTTHEAKLYHIIDYFQPQIPAGLSPHCPGCCQVGK